MAIKTPLARKIVANLAYRYRLTKRSYVGEVPENIRILRDVEVRAAWNAYVASRMMLYGDDQE